MNQKTNTNLNRFTELVHLKRTESDLWNTLKTNLLEAQTIGCLDNINLKQLVKTNKSMNNLLMAAIVKTTEESQRVSSLPSLPPPPPPPMEDVIV